MAQPAARQNDPVTGTDVHIVLTPSPGGPVPTPVPLPFSSPTLWRRVRDGSFPKPTKLSSRVTAWKVADVRAWIAAKNGETQQ